MTGKIERKVFGRQQQERIVAGPDRKDVGQAVTDSDKESLLQT